MYEIQIVISGKFNILAPTPVPIPRTSRGRVPLITIPSHRHSTQPTKRLNYIPVTHPRVPNQKTDASLEVETKNHEYSTDMGKFDTAGIPPGELCSILCGCAFSLSEHELL